MDFPPHVLGFAYSLLIFVSSFLIFNKPQTSQAAHGNHR